MALVVWYVNEQWCPLTQQTPQDWCVVVDIALKRTINDLGFAKDMCHFGTTETNRVSINGHWKDLNPTLDNKTSVNFLPSVLQVLNQVVDVQAELRLKYANTIFGHVFFTRQYQCSIGHTLICVKRLFMQWQMDAISSTLPPESVNDSIVSPKDLIYDMRKTLRVFLVRCTWSSTSVWCTAEVKLRNHTLSTFPLMS